MLKWVKSVLTEVKHGGRVTAGSVISHEVDLPLSLLLLDALLRLTVSIRAAAAEQDEHAPQQPKPWNTHKNANLHLVKLHWMICMSFTIACCRHTNRRFSVMFHAGTVDCIFGFTYSNGIQWVCNFWYDELGRLFLICFFFSM